MQVTLHQPTNDVLYAIASSRMGRVSRAAFCLVWLFLIIELGPLDYTRGRAIFRGDHGMVLAGIIFGSAAWALSTIQAFVNRTVFTEEGVEQRMLLRGMKSINYSDIRKTYVRSVRFVKAICISVLANDGQRMIIVGNGKQLARAEEIIRERVPAMR